MSSLSLAMELVGVSAATACTSTDDGTDCGAEMASGGSCGALASGSSMGTDFSIFSSASCSSGSESLDAAGGFGAPGAFGAAFGFCGFGAVPGARLNCEKCDLR